MELPRASVRPVRSGGSNRLVGGDEVNYEMPITKSWADAEVDEAPGRSPGPERAKRVRGPSVHPECSWA